MLQNFFKIIFRDLSKDKTYTAISILGLSAGISVSILIIAINFTYLSYDKFHEKGNRIYQAYLKNNFLEAGVEYANNTPYLLGEALKEKYPEISAAVTILNDEPLVFIVNNNSLKSGEEKGCYSEASLFNIFSFPVLASESNDEMLAADNSIGISKTLAEKYFGSVFNAVGKKITLRRTHQKKEVFVNVVFDDIPENSSIKFDYVLPLKSILAEREWLRNWPWGNLIATTFFELKDNVDVKNLNEKIKNFITEKNQYVKAELFLFKYEDAFLKSPGTANKTNYVIILFVVTVVILLIASINFINLSTSRATKKSREVGLRKIIGADRKSLILRFLAETFLLSFISVLIGMVFAEILLPVVNKGFNGSLIFSIPYNNLYFNLSLIALWIFVGIFSGIYPAIYLSALSPTSIIRNITGVNKRFSIRKSLITLQFVFSTIFIFITAVVFKQMNYITGKDLGLNINQVIEFNVTSEIENHLNAFTNDIKSNARINNITYASFEPTGIYGMTSDPYWEGKPKDLNDMFPIVGVDDDFIKTFNIQLAMGRDFYEGDSADNFNYLINEKMAKIIGKENPVGLEMAMWGNSGQIVGVVKNFHINTLMEEIKPLIIRKTGKGNRFAFINFHPDNLNEVLAFVEETYNNYEKEYPFKYSFLDEQFLKNHSEAKIFGSLFNLFSIIAIIISCLGLFGLTAFTIQQKTKEVGVRKVLGASINSITFMLTKSIIRLVLVASIIALPAGYYLSGIFLRMFVYKTEIGSEIYFASITIVLILASAAVVFQAIKAAAANPVKSIKYE